MNLSNLKAVIDTEPANAARTDAEVLAWLKESVTVWSDVSWEQFALWASRYDGIRKLETAKAGVDAGVATAAATGLIVLDAGKDLLLSISEVRSMMGDLVPDIFSTAEKNDLLAFSQSTQTRWLNEGFRAMGDKSKLVHINNSRAL